MKPNVCLKTEFFNMSRETCYRNSGFVNTLAATCKQNSGFGYTFNPSYTRNSGFMGMNGGCAALIHPTATLFFVGWISDSASTNRLTA